MNDILRKGREENKRIWNIIKNVETVELYKPAKARIADFVSMIENLRRELENGSSILEVTKKMLEQSGYLKSLVEENSAQSLTRRDNVLELQNAIAYYERSTRNPKLANFLQEITLITDTDKYDENKPAVTRSEEHTSELQSRGHLVCR